jgi:hypothetical protein
MVRRYLPIRFSVRTDSKKETRVLTDDLPRDTEHEAPRRHNAILGHERARTNDAPRPDARAVQHGRMNPDETVIINRRSMHDRGMTDRDVPTDRQRMLPIRMQHTAVLHIRAVADLDTILITAQDRMRKHPTLTANTHIADQHGSNCHKTRRMNTGNSLHTTLRTHTAI